VLRGRRGILSARESAGTAVGENDLQLTQNQIPVLASVMPLLYDPLGCQIQYSAQKIVVGKGNLILCHLTELAFNLSMMFVVYMVFRFAGGYLKNVFKTS